MTITGSIQQAQDKNTPSKTLAKLATDEDRLIRQYVASNPNTPVEILTKLALEFPDRVMANSVLDLLILENSDSVTAIKMAVAESSNASEEILNRLKNHSDRFVRYSVARNPNTPKDILVYYIEDLNPLVRYNVARNFNTPRNILVYLKDDPNPLVRYNVARNSNTPRNILVYLKGDSDPFVRYAFTQNIHPFMFTEILFHHNTIRNSNKSLSNIARSVNIPVWVLDYFKEDPEEIMCLINVLRAEPKRT